MSFICSKFKRTIINQHSSGFAEPTYWSTPSRRTSTEYSKSIRKVIRRMSLIREEVKLFSFFAENVRQIGMTYLQISHSLQSSAVSDIGFVGFDCRRRRDVNGFLNQDALDHNMTLPHSANPRNRTMNRKSHQQ